MVLKARPPQEVSSCIGKRCCPRCATPSPSKELQPSEPTTTDEERVLPCPCPCCGGRMIIFETFARGCQHNADANTISSHTAGARVQDRHLITLPSLSDHRILRRPSRWSLSSNAAGRYCARFDHAHRGNPLSHRAATRCSMAPSTKTPSRSLAAAARTTLIHPRPSG